jgi:hypothetical protein
MRYALVAAGALVMLAGVQGRAQPADTKAAAVLASARKALGGEQKITALKTLSIRGTYRRETSVPGGGGGGAVFITMSGPGPGGPSGQSTGDIEIDVELPDKYIKVDNGTGMMAMTRTEGFEGDRPFTDVSGTQPGMRIVVDNPAKNPEMRPLALKRSREELARLLLGVIAGTQPSFPVTFSYAGQAESPDGKADVLDVKGPDGFATRLFLDAGTHLPLMLTYTGPEPRIVMRTETAPPAGKRTEGAGHGGGSAGEQAALSPEEQARMAREMRDASAAPPKMVEFRVFFTDYREVAGLQLPHHITRGTADKTTEEWEIKSYKVNPTLKADRFKVGS